jgi:hypothetical protein
MCAVIVYNTSFHTITKAIEPKICMIELHLYVQAGGVLPGYSSLTDKHCRYITRLGPDFVRHISKTMPNVDPKVVQV